MDAYGAEDVDWRHGRGFSLVYDSPEPHQSLVLEAAARFANENALSAGAFPSASHFESAVISMVASVIAPRTATGRDLCVGRNGVHVHRAQGVPRLDAGEPFGRGRPGDGTPGVRKGRGVSRARARPGRGRRGRPARTRAVIDAIDERTAVVGLSAPCYPFGVVDPIAEIAEHARRGVGVHIDAALGGLFLPFLDAVGATPPEFGTDVPGVTSVAVDLHKYGYGAKGASVVLFADRELRRPRRIT